MLSSSNLPPSRVSFALVEELALAAQPIDSLRALADARWAIRVGEELVSWRQCCSFGQGSSPLGSATNRLELALEEARRLSTIHRLLDQTVDCNFDGLDETSMG